MKFSPIALDGIPSAAKAELCRATGDLVAAERLAAMYKRLGDGELLELLDDNGNELTAPCRQCVHELALGVELAMDVVRWTLLADGYPREHPLFDEIEAGRARCEGVHRTLCGGPWYGDPVYAAARARVGLIGRPGPWAEAVDHAH